jgi:hypothetical protein
MERLLSVMLRGYLDTDLWEMFTELSYFYRKLCAKQVSKMMMQKFKKEIPILIYKMEKSIPVRIVQCSAIFASSFTLGS